MSSVPMKEGSEIEACPEKKVLDKSVLSPGTMVEVRSMIDKAEETWVPGMVVSAFEEDGKKKFLIKDWKIYVSGNGEESRPNISVDAHLVRPIPPPSSVETFKLLETVEAFRNSKWCKGLVIGVLSDASYMISFEATKEESVFKHAGVRPLRVWENGVWRDGPKGNPIEESPSRILRKKAVSSSSSAKPMTPTNSVRLTRRSLNLEGRGETLQKCESVAATGGLRKKTVDAVMNETTSIATEAVSPVTPVISATPVKPTETETEGKRSEPARNQNGFGNDSNNNSTQQKVPEEEKSKDASRKRKRNEQDNADLSESGEEACNGIITCVANGEETTTTMSMVLPFQKKLRIWNTFESMEVFKTNPQTPHFSPLSKRRESSREMSAVGMMVAFSDLLEEVTNLQPFDPKSTLESLSDYFTELERHGFNVKTPQSRIHKLMSLKDKQAEKMEEHKRLERGIAEKESQKLENERKILLELQRMNEEADKEIAKMKSSAASVDQELKDVELQFQSTCRSP